MELDVALPGGAPIADQIDLAVAAERAGFHGVAVGDNPRYKQDPYIVLSEIAVAHSVANPAMSERYCFPANLIELANA